MSLQGSSFARTSSPPVALLLVVLLLAACSAQRGPDADQLRNRYLGAIRDAATAEPWEVSRRLRAVMPYTPGLVWRGEPGASEVLVVTWTRSRSFDDEEDQEIQLPTGRWVTLAPEVQDFCRDYKPAGGVGLELRLEQLLGLPPQIGKDRFVEFWVFPDDLMRPCPDPEITDTQCGLVFPGPAEVISVSEEYRAWFEDYHSTSYGDDGYPWTRLGYTYDWGNPRTEVGLSEFIIRAGSKVTVRGVQSNSEYCDR